MSLFPHCNSCDSTHLTSFSGEVALRSPGLKNLDKPTCFAFPQVVVCQDCGFSFFNLAPRELQRLSDCTESHQPAQQDHSVNAPLQVSSSAGITAETHTCKTH